MMRNSKFNEPKHGAPRTRHGNQGRPWEADLGAPAPPAPARVVKPEPPCADIRAPRARNQLAYRVRPYFRRLAHGRHIGFAKHPSGDHWVARITLRDGRFRQARIGAVRDRSRPGRRGGLTYEQAVTAAERWFDDDAQRAVAVAIKPPGRANRVLIAPTRPVEPFALDAAGTPPPAAPERRRTPPDRRAGVSAKAGQDGTRSAPVTETKTVRDRDQAHSSKPAHHRKAARPDRYTIAHALDAYIEWKRLTASASHLAVMISLVNFHIIPRLGDVPVDDFNGEHARAFIRDVLETPPKRGNTPLGPKHAIESLDPEALRKRRKTVNTLIGILRLALLMAWEDKRTDNDRAWRCLRHLPNSHKPRLLHLDRDECRRLLTHCREDLGDLVRAALYSGCRMNELLDLRAIDIGRDGSCIYVAPAKTHRARFVFLPDEGMAFFKRKARCKRPDRPIFTRLNGTLWRADVRRLFKQAARAAGLPADFTFHGLRHTYASQLIQAGAPTIVVAEQLGHANTNCVSQTYGHLAPQIREAEVRQRFAALEGRRAHRNSLKARLQSASKSKAPRQGMRPPQAISHAKPPGNERARAGPARPASSYATIHDLSARARTEGDEPLARAPPPKRVSRQKGG